MSGVKVGDRVRARCGESVIIGVVKDKVSYGVSILPDGNTRLNQCLFDGWTIEVIAPPIPDIVGTIVRDKDGDAWERCEGGWYSARPMLYNPYVFADLQEYAPLEVLWTPEP